ncbi:MAG TPA: hypothetical protein VFC92_02555 [Bacteroidales bacterium]|nr:hypothetical protein [Bacteroidales bacterium]
MKIATIVLTFITTLLIGCSRTPSATAIFDHYLNKTFGLSIADDEHYYLIIPSYGCIGCIEVVFEELLENLPESSDKFTWIVSADQKQYQSRLNGYKVLIDNNNDIGSTALNIGNITVIHTFKGKVKEITNLNSKEDAQRYLNPIDDLNLKFRN